MISSHPKSKSFARCHFFKFEVPDINLKKKKKSFMKQYLNKGQKTDTRYIYIYINKSRSSSNKSQYRTKFIIVVREAGSKRHSNQVHPKQQGHKIQTGLIKNI